MRSSTARPERIARDSLAVYLREIRSYPLLTREEEVELAQRIRDGDDDAADRLVCANLRFVVSVAKKYQNRGASLSDLINEGNLGLLRAAARFDETKNVRFISYAIWWIRQAIVHALADASHAVRLPAARAGAVYRARRTSDRLRQELQREPTRREVAAALAVDEAELEITEPVARECVSLDAPLSDDDDGALLDYIADDTRPAVDAEVAGRGLKTFVDEAMQHLRGRQAMVLRMYFGLDGNDPMTLEEIGDVLDITRERARQIKERALSRLRRSKSASALASYYE